MDHVVNYANDGCYDDIGYGGRGLYATAQGRNGTREIKALNVWEGEKYVSLTPITRAKSIHMNCRIEVPKDSASLGRLIEILTAIHDSIVDKELMA